jgi:hypothetical protein
MIRYRLDDLGWFQFEWLIQSVLKAELGIGVQSWGGRGDQGRDAFINAPLYFPNNHTRSKGPFLFQMKFVEMANAAGADPSDRVLSAVRNEVSLIKKRLNSTNPTISTVWPQLRHYVLVSNAVLTGTLRSSISHAISKVVPAVQVHSLGGNDVCDILDRHPELRRAFPQLLSLRDLDELLTSAVNREVLSRSEAALREARDVISSFVPTTTYTRAFKVLGEHHFIVLQGPPEMGKTAIAWMIAIVQLSQGWQAIVCDSPEDFFRLFERDAHQVFIADDAFGRTEYDPTRGAVWERQLGRILRQVDPKHYLIWTSRKHILERARKVLDLEGGASRFPNPASVVVDASELTIAEKALILYRHARSAMLDKVSRELIRREASSIVHHPAFTPERIRRFIFELVPKMVADRRATLADRKRLKERIREAIANPTDRMRKTFEQLSEAHKWLLVSLLEAETNAEVSEVERLYNTYRPSRESQPFGRTAGGVCQGP